jgi:hypothetical protein
MPFFKDGLDYYFLNVLVFLMNIGIGYFLHLPVLVFTSILCLAIIIYIKELDYTQHSVYLLDQVAMLGILLPGLYAWIESGPHKRLVAGALFLTAAAIYATGVALTKFSHSPKREDREFWHFVMHLFSTGGHIGLVLEPMLLYLVMGKRA